MAIEPTDPTDTPGGTPLQGDPVPGVPEHGPGGALQEPGVADAAPAAQADVVSLADAKERKARAAGSAGADSSPPPLPQESAVAQPEGNGGGGGKSPAKGKPERKIDWGKVNELVVNFALIYGTDTVWDGVNRIIMKIANMAHAHGSESVKQWKNHPDRRQVMPQHVVFDPTERCDPELCVNLYGGLAMQPVDGDVTPFLDLVRYLTSRAGETPDESDAIMHWLLCWLAYPLQHRGAKLKTAVVMHGDEGAGKNFLFDTIVAIYGEYGAMVGQDELEDKFNDWRSRKLFVVGDEVSSRQELVHNKNRLKALITSPVVLINPKNLPRREEANHINIVFLSNELQPQALDNTDRRYCVIYTPPRRDAGFYQALGRWHADQGPAKVMQYLLSYPLDDFDPNAEAPRTQAKADLIDLNRKSPERFWREWSANELDLPYWSCSIAQAYQAYLKYCQRTGERYPMQRNLFTRMVMRMSETEGRPVREKVMKVGDVANKKCERMLLVTEPPDGTPQGEWATSCVATFETELKKYLGFGPRSPGDGDTGEGGGQ